MSEKKFSKILIVISIIVALIIVALLGYWGYDIYRKNLEQREANKAINEAENNIRRPGYSSVPGPGNNGGNGNSNTANSNTSTFIDVNTLTEPTQDPSSGNQEPKKQNYKGYALAGYIEIPSIKLSPEKMPILERFNSGSSEGAPGINYGPGLNKVGNTIVFGHNYRNGTHFSNIENLKNNDVIYVTDLYNGHQRVKYTVYNVFQTAANDFDYATEGTNGARVISLSTCYGDDNNEDRTVVQARAE